MISWISNSKSLKDLTSLVSVLYWRHKRTDLESSFVYFAWAKTRATDPTEVTEYSAFSLSEPLIFSSSLPEVTVQWVPQYDPQIEAIKILGVCHPIIIH